MTMPKLGSGARFAALRSELARRGARNPDALAAVIGRKTLGKQKFQQLSEAGRRRSMAANVSRHPGTGRFQSHGAPKVEGSPAEEAAESAAQEAAEKRRMKR